MKPSGLPVPSKPRTGRSPARLRAACWRGEEPAEALTQTDREELLYELWAAGWTDQEVAAHCRMSTYTTVRIRTRLGLPARTAQRDTA